MAKRRKTRPAPRQRRKGISLRSLLQRLPFFQTAEFKPDAEGTGFVKLLHLTLHQRMTILRWSLYVGVCVLALLVQDIIMSRIHIFGATTDLVVSTLLLLTVIEGCEVGSIIALVGSTLYFFSGSSPGAYSVGLLTVFGMLASITRQKYLHRSAGSVITFAALAIFAYEIGLFGIGVFLGLTRWGRLGRFIYTAIYSSAALFPLYAVISRVGQIGGYTWKE